MPDPASFIVAANIDPRQLPREGPASARISQFGRSAAASILVLSSFVVAPAARGQVPAIPGSTTSTGQSQTGNGDSTSSAMSVGSEDSGRDGNGPTSIANPTSQTALSAEQIISILQDSPDLVVELKSELADRMQQQDIQIDPNEISDQMLYSQISSNANLRASITSVLQARGYVSDGDLQSVGSSVPDEEVSQFFVLCEVTSLAR